MFEKTRGVARKYGAAAGAVLASAVALPSHAAGEAQAAFTAALTEASADVAVYGAGLVGLAAVGVAFMIGVKYIKKVRGAS